MEAFETRFRTDLDNILQPPQILNGIMMTGDKNANRIIVELYHGLDKVVTFDEDIQVVGYFMRSDGVNIETSGTIEENGDLLIIVPEEAYRVPGMMSVSVRLLMEPSEDEEEIIWGKKMVVATFNCLVRETTATYIDPEPEPEPEPEDIDPYHPEDDEEDDPYEPEVDPGDVEIDEESEEEPEEPEGGEG